MAKSTTWSFRMVTTTGKNLHHTRRWYFLYDSYLYYMTTTIENKNSKLARSGGAALTLT